MSFGTFIVIAICAVVVLPIVAFLVMKFGTAGYLRAKQRQKEKDGT